MSACERALGVMCLWLFENLRNIWIVEKFMAHLLPFDFHHNVTLLDHWVSINILIFFRVSALYVTRNPAVHLRSVQF